MTISVPLLAIGLLAAVGAGGIFLVPGSGPSVNIAASGSRPSAVSKLYIALLEQATIRHQPVALAAPTIPATRASVLPASPNGASLSTDKGAVPDRKSLESSTIGPVAVNMRAASNSRSSVFSVLPPGQSVRVGATVGGWVEVTLPSGESGWVYGQYLTRAVALTRQSAILPVREDTKGSRR